MGVQRPADLEALIAEKARGNVFLTVLGFGMGGDRDAVDDWLDAWLRVERLFRRRLKRAGWC